MAYKFFTRGSGVLVEWAFAWGVRAGRRRGVGHGGDGL